MAQQYDAIEEGLPSVELRVGDGGLVVFVEGFPLPLTPDAAALFAQKVFAAAARANRDIRLDVAGHG